VDLERRLREGPLKIRDVWSAEQTAALSAQVVRLRRRRSLTHVGTLLGAVLSSALVVALWTRNDDPKPPRESAQVAAVAAPPVVAVELQPTLVLGDGSRAEPIDAESRFEITRDRPERVTVVLQRGGARFAVASRAERRFEVESGPVLVRVKGTTFSVTRSEGTTRVAVEDGHVQVFWAGEKAELFAGDAGTFPPPDAPLEPPRVGTNAGESAKPSAGAWRELAKKGEFRRAYSAMRDVGTRVADVPEDHMLAADVARLSGHPQQAVVHLRAVSERFPDDPRAPVAAFTLGRVLKDLERPGEAAAAFRRARTLWPRGPLALDAWAGEAEALRDAGDLEAAERLAVRYLERHPSGRHAQAMRALSR
jgi:transmembrane sensor